MPPRCAERARCSKSTPMPPGSPAPGKSLSDALVPGLRHERSAGPTLRDPRRTIEPSLEASRHGWLAKRSSRSVCSNCMAQAAASCSVAGDYAGLSDGLSDNRGPSRRVILGIVQAPLALPLSRPAQRRTESCRRQHRRRSCTQSSWPRTLGSKCGHHAAVQHTLFGHLS